MGKWGKELSYQSDELEGETQTKRDRIYRLSVRELEVLSLLANGKSNKEIALLLCIPALFYGSGQVEANTEDTTITNYVADFDVAKNGDLDCDDGLTCTKKSELIEGITDRCCPAEGTESDKRCTHGVPTVVLGLTPFNMGGADEYVLVDELLAVAKIHTLVAYDFLSSEH